ncbi:MAG: transcription antitermination protein NusB [Gomphosphaeria aponina SAG 52.96 = DSM 107014]|uniref:Transcription antitermination protein NusB n=1 Tax=Gomphosphaeria aponina SAG 52.96 = DSM 107014 TaxID=1521640 RepID=A0A941JTR3_9CHRO|nr:transcription antitermination protein NusB [Gomphosphaeria aponina SAG 52.96 = DSM 107014]
MAPRKQTQPLRQQPRRIARELALLSLSQVNAEPEKLQEEELEHLVTAATRTLTGEIQDALEKATTEVKRGNEKILRSEICAGSLEEAKAMINEALQLTKAAINHLGAAVELPEFIALSKTYEVRAYALELIGVVHRRNKEIETTIETVLVDWQLSRLPKIDRDLLTMAVAEILFLDIPYKVAVNEAVELAKRYSDEEGYRFINGVLRRVIEKNQAALKSR